MNGYFMKSTVDGDSEGTRGPIAGSEGLDYRQNAFL